METTTERPLRVCHQCGLLTPNTVLRCLECGALPPEVEQERRERQRAASFVEAVFFRRSPVSYVLIGINLVMFLLTAVAGGSTDPDVLTAFGACNQKLIANGEVWRLVVPMFLHIGVVHLVVNMYALWVLGPQLESLYGSARFTLLYILSGIGGFVASYFFAHPASIGAGASGALFGMFGALLVFVYKYRHEIPPSVRVTMQRGVWLTLAINLIITFSIPFISRSGHLGGLITGIGLALFIPYSPPYEQKTPLVWRICQLMLVAAVAASFGAMFWHYQGERPSLARFLAGSNLFPENKVINQFAEACNEGERVYRLILRQLETDQPVPTELRNASVTVRQRLKQLRPFNDGATRLVTTLHNLLEAQAATFDQPTPRPIIEQMREGLAAYEREQQRWITEEGARYGLQFVPSTDPDANAGEKE
ncbi:MAG: rhomboid family intramembrane serine protease [Chloracidobacterium sp.]|uniref:Rhomboid family intramembrane serine protease n=1 Tax=Chloracidobacterium validum TaxID=2821543 RepID=A0ABX8B7C8_9BACT|nr:rhomboid family intramembrane serine protease [Chloracidobacterium validum]QUW02859.1 rhomboid family intramembrane serine protease [Chloracidobacterium validum]